MDKGCGDYNAGRELVKAHQAEMRRLKEQDRLARLARSTEGGQGEGWLAALWRRLRPSTTVVRTPEPPTTETSTAPWRRTSGAWPMIRGE